MSRLNKAQRDHASADLAQLDAMLMGLTDDDIVMRMSLEARRNELIELLAEPALEDTVASADIYFSGKPVIGELGIESGFGGRAVSIFQDLVAKEFACMTGGIGQRGVVPNKGAARLHITNIVRGSFGFHFEELSSQAPLVDTSLKAAVRKTLELMDVFAHSDENGVQEELASTDPRVLSTARDFFKLVHEEGAKFRAVSGDFDKSFDINDVETAFSRTTALDVFDADLEEIGTLLGILPDSHKFEFEDLKGNILRGNVSKDLPAPLLSTYLEKYLTGKSVAVLNLRQVRRGSEILREKHTLIEMRPYRQD